jgi:hypothetical protein
VESGAQHGAGGVAGAVEGQDDAVAGELGVADVTPDAGKALQEVRGEVAVAAFAGGAHGQGQVGDGLGVVGSVVGGPADDAGEVTELAEQGTARGLGVGAVIDGGVGGGQVGRGHAEHAGAAVGVVHLAQRGGVGGDAFGVRVAEVAPGGGDGQGPRRAPGPGLQCGEQMARLGGRLGAAGIAAMYRHCGGRGIGCSEAAPPATAMPRYAVHPGIRVCDRPSGERRRTAHGGHPQRDPAPHRP